MIDLQQSFHYNADEYIFKNNIDTLMNQLYQKKHEILNEKKSDNENHKNDENIKIIKTLKMYIN